MTEAQENFKKAIAYRKKTGCSLKDAFAYVKGNKPTKKKVGALPVGFVGTFYDISFKIINQFDIYNNVNAIVEDKKNGNVITTITGNQNSLINTDMFLNYAKLNSEYSVKNWDSIKTKINKFFELIKKEVKSYNAGKTKTIKKQTIKILPPTKKVEKIIVKSVRQTGSSNTKYDKLKQALPVGKRKSASGKTYYEYRKDHSDAGVLLGFFDTTVIKDIDNLKKQYFKLAKIYHPDKGGTTTQFQELGREYDKLLKTLLSGSSLTDEQQKNEIEIDEAIKQIIDTIITFDGLNIELIGKWLWVSNNIENGYIWTIRPQLEAAGLKPIKKGGKWFFIYKGIESKSRGNMSKDEIERKYGVHKVTPKDKKKLGLIGAIKPTTAQKNKLLKALKRLTKALDKRPI